MTEERIPERYEYRGEIWTRPDEVRVIHPAIDLTGDEAFVGVWLPMVRLRGTAQKFQYKFFLVSSDRYKIFVTPESLAEHALLLSHTPVRIGIKPRWSPRGIDEFINGWTPNPEEVYEGVREQVEKYIDFEDKRLYDFITLVIINSYFYTLFSATPYIFVTGVKRTGKTKLLTLMKCLGFNAVVAGSASASSLFRIIHNARSMFLMDEQEALADPERMREIRPLLTTGYKRGATVYRTEKEEGEKPMPVPFETYSPKAFANISGIEDILLDRCLVVRMQRTTNEEIANSEINEEDPVWQALRDELYSLTLSYWKEVRELSNASIKLEGISGRHLEITKPIIQLARFFANHNTSGVDGNLLSSMEELIRELVVRNEKEESSESPEALILRVLLKIVENDDYYKLSDIIDKALTMYHYNKAPKWLNSRSVGRLLTNLGFTEKKKVAGVMEYRMSPKLVQSIAKRYLGAMYEEVLEELDEYE